VDFEKTGFKYISWIALAKGRIFWQVSVIMVRNLAVSVLHGVYCIEGQVIVR
jgi:hypothetical protein